MEIFFQFLGAFGVVVLIVLVLVVIAAMILWAKFKKMLKEFAEEVGKFADNSEGNPQRVTLVECDDPVWKDADGAEHATKAFEQRGLKCVANFKVNEFPKLSMRAFVKGDEGLLGIIYEMEPVGQWLDLCKHYANDSSLTITNSVVGEGLKQRENHRKVRSEGASADELINILKEHDLGDEADMLDGSLEAFKHVFEKAYADEMDWRNAMGGPDEDEIRAVAVGSGIDASDEAVELTRALKQRQACEGLNIALSERYRSKQSLNETSWRELSERIVFVHDKLPEELLSDLFEDHKIELPPDTDIAEILNYRSARQTFECVNNRLKTDERFRKIDTLEEPLPTDVYERSLRN